MSRQVVVEVDALSGRTNPAWTLDDDSAARLATIVSRLTLDADGTPASVPGLGFRGFVVRGLADSTLRVRVNGVVATAGDRQTMFADPGHELYSTLRQLALDHVSPGMAAAIPAAEPQL